jgi:hypothetical protein
MKMKHRKLMMKAVLVCGSCMLLALYNGGCSSDKKDSACAEKKPDLFEADDAERIINRFQHVQQASGAREDATLQPYHFDKGALNSLGRQKLSLMIDDDEANNPVTIYLNVPANDEFKSARQDAVVAYLKDQGLEESQVAFKAGTNPNQRHPAEDGIARLPKTETGAAGGSDGAAASGEQSASSAAGGGLGGEAAK